MGNFYNRGPWNMKEQRIKTWQEVRRDERRHQLKIAIVLIASISTIAAIGCTLWSVV